VARPSTRSLLVLVGIAVLVLVAVAAFTPVPKWLGIAWPFSSPKGPAARPGFEERALESGLSFMMKFLPGEQGERFKINLYDHGSGLAIGDFDGDGYDDIYFLNQLGENALYRNNGDGTFTDVTQQAGVALGDRVCTAAAFADTLNKGRQDLYVASTRGGNVFFRNMGNGTFKDVTEEAGLTHIGHSQSVVFFDYNNDGYLDLFVTNTAKWTNADDQDRRYFDGNSLGVGPDDDMVTST